jgi:3-oxoacyl-[acyl-carrier-protein] synthase II
LKRVAVTGLGVVSPVGVGKDAFFANLVAAHSGIVRVDFPEASRLKMRLAALVPDFNPAASLSRDRMAQLDRFSQFGLVAVREAWAQSGGTQAPSDARGCFWGTGMGGAGTVEAGYAALYRDRLDRVRPLSVVMAMSNAAAANIAIEYDIRGPCFTYAVACASSTIAIGEAHRAIASGHVEMAVAGGSEALLTFGVMKSWEALMTLAVEDREAPQTSCRPFALDRTGLVLGEGAGALILEEFEHARDRGARVLAEIAGYGTSNDAKHLSRPDPAGQARAMTRALDEARQLGVRREDIGYLNAHGTATRAGDLTETVSIKQVFGTGAGCLPVSSTKAVHGHLMGAGGAVEFIAALLAMDKRTLPPTAHLWRSDPECDLDYVPLTARAAPRLAAVMSNSFGFGGANACLVARNVE